MKLKSTSAGSGPVRTTVLLADDCPTRPIPRDPGLLALLWRIHTHPALLDLSWFLAVRARHGDPARRVVLWIPRARPDHAIQAWSNYRIRRAAVPFGAAVAM